MEDNKFENNMEEISENVSGEVLETESDEEVSNTKKGWKRELFEWVEAIVIAVVISFLLKNFVLTLVKVQGASMEPTLQSSDRLYVNRLLYTPEKGLQALQYGRNCLCCLQGFLLLRVLLRIFRSEGQQEPVPSVQKDF